MSTNIKKSDAIAPNLPSSPRSRYRPDARWLRIHERYFAVNYRSPGDDSHGYTDGEIQTALAVAVAVLASHVITQRKLGV